jgi:hypothetical protein
VLSGHTSDEAQQDVAAATVGAWGVFAHTSALGAAAAWPGWRGPGSVVHRFTADAAYSGTADPAAEHHCAFWANLER